MSVSIGDVVVLKVTQVADYACWGKAGELTGFVHCVEWGWERPILPIDCPEVGACLMVKIFHLVEKPQNQLPLDVTFGETINVDFAASVRLIRPKPASAGN